MLTRFLASFPWALYLARYVVMLIAFTAHELGHALAATALGDPTPREEGRLTLDPRRHVEHIGGILAVLIGIGWSKPTHIRPDKMRVPDALGGAISVLAGPLANLALVGIGMAGLRWIGSGPVSPWNTWPDLAGWLTVLVRLNLGLALLNLLPLFPLDGWLLIHAVLPLRATWWWERASAATTALLGVGLAALFLLPTPWVYALARPLVGWVSKSLLGW